MAAPVAAAKAAIFVWRNRRLLIRLSAGLMIAAVAGLTLVIAVLSALVGSIAGGNGTPAAIQSAGGLPALAGPWLAVINVASQAYQVDPYLLISILEQETDYGTNPSTYTLNFAGCCRGPFQFNLVNGPPSTWQTVANAYQAAPRPASYPHPAEPHPSVDDSFDAAMAAALLLRRTVNNRPLSTLGDDAWQAACNYYGCNSDGRAYADAVLTRARRYEAAARTSTPNPGSAGDLGTGQLAWPVRGPITSPFGQRWGRMHEGIDIGVPIGTPVAAAAAGVVVLASPVSGYGNYLCIRHTVRLTTCYGHLSAYVAHLNDQVDRGQIVARSGCTGHCTGPHVHFEVRLGPDWTATPTDPVPYLQ